MKIMRISLAGETPGDGFIFTSKDNINPALCRINNLTMDEVKPLMNMRVDWINRGSYTNGQLKKLVRRTLIRTIRYSIRLEIHNRNTKERNV